MHCPFCKRAPRDIPEYIEQANFNEMSPNDYVRMDEGTYHAETDLFCCTDCYIKIGSPLNSDLAKVFRDYRKQVIPLKR
ncbi:hypothetical protein [Clostridium sp. 1xD42-85]|uniref:hypothetical protein n=1 Tax=Clostridium sp. 1xD42-85 TaxID=2320084 RepID=UPI000EA123CF|nr:hypothetical protein [Clostridium sp. 1xD42-85]NBJ71020.1 hypothetical protein [Roseburia sp. 1XD42-34]RKI75455.1 hypothetical protein D7V87_16390 [Clostridium sp. 1xD42-85]